MNFCSKSHLLSSVGNFGQILLSACEGDFGFFCKSSFVLEQTIILSHKGTTQLLFSLADLNLVR